MPSFSLPNCTVAFDNQHLALCTTIVRTSETTYAYMLSKTRSKQDYVSGWGGRPGQPLDHLDCFTRGIQTPTNEAPNTSSLKITTLPTMAPKLFL